MDEDDVLFGVKNLGLDLWFEVRGREQPFSATGHFPVLAGYDASGKELYVGRVTPLDRSRHYFTYVSEGAASASYINKSGHRKSTHRFDVLVLRHDPCDVGMRVIPEGAKFQTGPLYWLRCSGDGFDPAVEYEYYPNQRMKLDRFVGIDENVDDNVVQPSIAFKLDGISAYISETESTPNPDSNFEDSSIELDNEDSTQFEEANESGAAGTSREPMAFGSKMDGGGEGLTLEEFEQFKASVKECERCHRIFTPNGFRAHIPVCRTKKGKRRADC